MAKPHLKWPDPLPVELDGSAVLNALPHPVVVVDPVGVVAQVNLAAQHFFECSAHHLCGHPLADHLAADSPLFGVIDQARASGGSVSEDGVTLESPRIGGHLVGLQVAALPESPGHVVISIHERTMAHKLDRSLTHRSAARSVVAMAAMLAHEVKNPLSGIRGAAQLLDDNVSSADDRQLTQLIVDETDRICALVDRMEVFSDSRPLERGAVNIHQVLDHVRRIATNGFARRVRLTEKYDPSLPPVLGNRDQLVQVFLNLVKNAAEAVPEEGGDIVISTAYQHGMRLAVPGSDKRVHLPLVVSIEDNGAGIPEDLRPHLFDPFVTTKQGGTGLGLALVAKLIGEHGGVIEFDSQPRRTVFRVMLPLHPSPGEA
ncbi:MAG: PAS domain-containing protein [Alphaproteobacteria bacterium]|nr:PAS domain-containing protein [Alphaproteobacteria bacterium]